MTQIHIRSRIGYWSAFATQAGSFLNIRDADGRMRTVRLTDEDVEILNSEHETAHAHARMLVEQGERVPTMPTPKIGAGEPVPYDWREAIAPAVSEARLAA